MWDKIRKILYEASDFMELLMAGAVACGIAIAAVTLWPELLLYWSKRLEAGAFMEYLDAVFNVVIGIEFFKMLCKPSSGNIIEVLVFLIARHMIVQDTTPAEDLISVISISILFFLRHFFPADKQHGRIRHLAGRMKRIWSILGLSAPSGKVPDDAADGQDVEDAERP